MPREPGSGPISLHAFVEQGTPSRCWPSRRTVQQRIASKARSYDKRALRCSDSKRKAISTGQLIAAITSTPLTIPTPETALTYTLYGNSGLVVKAGEATGPEEGAEDALSGKVTPVEASLLANP